MENQKEENKEGLLFVNKPLFMTSHDVVDVARKKLKIKKIGHAGTLDPLAEGLLILLVGKYTKFFSKFVNYDKEYLGVLKLGEKTSTGDSEGEVLEKKPYDNISEPVLKEAFNKFVGNIKQIPPMVSAVRVNGKRLYKLARKGIEVKREPRDITIHSLKINKCDYPLVEFYTHCSKGTYIRKLAEDIGETLGCGAHMISIKRTAIGPFKLDEAIKLDEIDDRHLKKISSW